MAEINWHGPAVQAQIRAELTRRISAACIVVENHAKQLVSVEGAGGSGNTRLSYNANPSAPGDPPHVQTGRLRSSIAHEVDGLTGRVGTNVIYGRWLELGTSRMAARPWLRRALGEMTAAVTAIIGRPM